MTERRIHAAILEAAFAEQDHLPGEVGTLAFTETAERLADSLYRLTVEFGVSFNDFKRAVLDEVPNRQRSGARRGTLFQDEGIRAELAVLALELMRDDSDL